MKARSYQHASLWFAAVLVGGAAVLYARLITAAQKVFFGWFAQSPYLVSLGTPFVFVLATAVVRYLAPEAKGSGIPQVLEAIHCANIPQQTESTWRSGLVSIRTALIKVISSLVGILGGASIGREGPTVQIAASLFAWIGRVTRRRADSVQLPFYLVAGSAAGVAAAFNTPLAGITFAIEEVLEGSFGTFRQAMMLAVIISGITAQAFLGNYLYFGHPAISQPDVSILYMALLIGAAGGLSGGLFSRILAYPQAARLPKHWALRAFACGAICAILALATHGNTAGSGYEPTEAVLMASSADQANPLFPIYKFLTTVLSYLSGMAGGIFSPSLSIGAGIGISIAKLFGIASFGACALIGMVAFFSGVVQAPLTAVIIVTEMTDRHILILPFMVAAFLGQGVGRLLMPVPIYRYLATRNEEA